VADGVAALVRNRMSVARLACGTNKRANAPNAAMRVDTLMKLLHRRNEMRN